MTRTATALLAAALASGTLSALAIGDPGLPAMPDPALTPGAVASTDRAEICSYVGGLSYSKRHRHTTPEMKDTVLRAYAVPRPFRGEIDHRVPLCAGGADTLENLWPETDFKAKDELEAAVCRDICHGRVSVADGQAIFLGDWRGSLAARMPLKAPQQPAQR